MRVRARLVSNCSNWHPLTADGNTWTVLIHQLDSICVRVDSLKRGRKKLFGLISSFWSFSLSPLPGLCSRQCWSRNKGVCASVSKTYRFTRYCIFRCCCFSLTSHYCKWEKLGSSLVFHLSNISSHPWHAHFEHPVSITAVLFLQTRHSSNPLTTQQQGCSRAPDGQTLPLSSSLNSTTSLFDTALTTNCSCSPSLLPSLRVPPLPALGWSPIRPHLTPQHKGCEGVQLHCSSTLELATPSSNLS